MFFAMMPIRHKESNTLMLPMSGIFLVFVAGFGGYKLEPGNPYVLMQPAEILIVLGAAVGITLVSNRPAAIRKMWSGVRQALRPPPRYERAFCSLSARRSIPDALRPLSWRWSQASNATSGFRERESRLQRSRQQRSQRFRRRIQLKPPPEARGHRSGGAWKVAYADFVTTLIALFLVLWMRNASAPVKQSVSGYFRDPRGYTRKLRPARLGREKDCASIAKRPRIWRAR
jgi:hypothetical protein